MLKETDKLPVPSLWIGTSEGSCIAIDLNIPTNRKDRETQTCFPAPCPSTIIRTNNGLNVLKINILDSCFKLHEQQSYTFLDEQTQNHEICKQHILCVTKKTIQISSIPDKKIISHCEFETIFDLPPNDAIVQQCDVKNFFKRSSHAPPLFLCYLESRQLGVLSIPHFRLMYQDDIIADLNGATLSSSQNAVIQSTVSFGMYGQIAYMINPSELVLCSLNREVYDEMSTGKPLALLFKESEDPEAPKTGAIKDFFFGSTSISQSMEEREELLGAVDTRHSGLSTTTAAKYNKNHNLKSSEIQGQGAAAELARAQRAAIERGEKLGQVEVCRKHIAPVLQTFCVIFKTGRNR